jgi:hypothetical protein
MIFFPGLYAEAKIAAVREFAFVLGIPTRDVFVQEVRKTDGRGWILATRHPVNFNPHRIKQLDKPTENTLTVTPITR